MSDIDREVFVFDTNHPEMKRHNGRYRREEAFQEVLGALRQADEMLMSIAAGGHTLYTAKLTAKAAMRLAQRALANYPVRQEAKQ